MDVSDDSCHGAIRCRSCNKTFQQASALSCHLRSCRSTQVILSSALSKAKRVWSYTQASKRQKLTHGLETRRPNVQGVDASGSGFHGGTDGVNGFGVTGAAVLSTGEDEASRTPDATQTSPGIPPTLASGLSAHGVDSAGSDLSIAARRTRRDIRPPKRYRDVIPQPPAPLLSRPILIASVEDHSTAAESPPSTTLHEAGQLNRVTAPAQSPSPCAAQPLSPCLDSVRNIFHIFRRYHTREFPSHDPDEELSLELLSDVPGTPSNGSACHGSPGFSSFGPYPNKSSFLLGEWFWQPRTQVSQSDFRDLVNVLNDQDFRLEDIKDTRWDWINQQLGDDESNGVVEEGPWVDAGAGWTQETLQLTVPFHKRTTFPGNRMFQAGTFYRRSITAILRERLTGPDSCHFHYDPYELYWQPDLGRVPIRVFGELYTSPEFIRVHHELQASPPEPGCNLPRIVVGLLFSSDVTHLTQFGDAKLWPVYLFFGNDSKYRRCKPSCRLCNHLAYLQTLPDYFDDFASHYSGKAPAAAFKTHCHRQLFHEQWKAILDDEFMEAYRHGIVISCSDGNPRRFYPRIFAYIADYPEKILAASIRNRGHCPCPRCLIQLNDVYRMGQKADQSKRHRLIRTDNPERRAKVERSLSLIYREGHAVDATVVENLLRDESWVPTANAFSDRLQKSGFDLYRMFLPDIMHEFDQGVWRSTFIHLLRILSYINERLLYELNRRYRDVPTFGRDTIRKFSRNTSEMKKLAAHDWEDMLQCAIPVFEGLLPEPHNKRLLELLFLLASWQGLAKLRLHTEDTLQLLDNVTASLGNGLRAFKVQTCSKFDTKELPREVASRSRREISQKLKKQKRVIHPTVTQDASAPASISSISEPFRSTGRAGCSGGGTTALQNPDTLARHVSNTNDKRASVPGTGESTSSASLPKPQSRKTKGFNLNTYKLHSLGDYAQIIRRYGTTDSFSTQIGEVSHRDSKASFSRTSKKDFVKQLTRIERRQARIRRIRERLQATHQPSCLGAKQNDTLPSHATSIALRYEVGNSQNNPVDISEFLQNNRGDPAIQDFLPRLKAHLLPRIQERIHAERMAEYGSEAPSYTDETNKDCVLIHKGRMYGHKIIRFNYTTYDMRRDQDTINPRTPHCNLMLLAVSEDSTKPSGHPFVYGRVLGIYHVNVLYKGRNMVDYNPRRFDFLWVRWYDLEPSVPQRGKQLENHLDRLAFPPMKSEHAFGFVDPTDVLRGSHIIPAFARGPRHPDEKGVSKCASDSRDWKGYYVSRFVDRDMLMRYHWGKGIGHTYSWQSAATSASPSINLDPAPPWPSTSEEHEINSAEDQTLNTRDSSSAPQFGIHSGTVEEEAAFTLDDLENEFSDAGTSSPGGSERDVFSDREESDDEVYIEMMETY